MCAAIYCQCLSDSMQVLFHIAGFLYTGTTIHDRIGDFQYIAPLQANFEPSNGSESGIYIYSSGMSIIQQPN